MLDFDFICKRTTPSVAGIIYTFGGQFVSKMYWGTSETLLPVYQDVAKAIAKHPDVDTVVNFASSRSVYTSTMELMELPQIRSIAIIAEGVPERVSPIRRYMFQINTNLSGSELERSWSRPGRGV